MLTNWRAIYNQLQHELSPTGMQLKKLYFEFLVIIQHISIYIYIYKKYGIYTGIAYFSTPADHSPSSCQILHAMNTRSTISCTTPSLEIKSYIINISTTWYNLLLIYITMINKTRRVEWAISFSKNFINDHYTIWCLWIGGYMFRNSKVWRGWFRLWAVVVGIILVQKTIRFALFGFPDHSH